ncbi:MAG: YARHG domain-containing protein [Clostridiales bacterium]|nr:YARHG domain-containing protein [Candidatus Blautia equi]
MKKSMRKMLSVMFFVFSMLFVFPVMVSAAENYLVPEADSRKYTKEEISDMSLQVVCYAKNEIYARHGRLFVSQELSEYFNEQSWYKGTVSPNSFSQSVFNTNENANIRLLSDREHELNSSGYPVDKKGYNFDEVYAYLNRFAAPPIWEDFVYDSKSKTISTNCFTMKLPDNWAKHVKYSKESDDSITFYCSDVRVEKTGYGGVLCSIMREIDFVDPETFPDAVYLGSSPDFYYYILYPSDVQFDPNRLESAKIYKKMSRSTNTIEDTFELIY